MTDTGKEAMGELLRQLENDGRQRSCPEMRAARVIRTLVSERDYQIGLCQSRQNQIDYVIAERDDLRTRLAAAEDWLKRCQAKYRELVAKAEQDMRDLHVALNAHARELKAVEARAEAAEAALKRAREALYWISDSHEDIGHATYRQRAKEAAGAALYDTRSRSLPSTEAKP